ncbi:hypothetical protein PR202_ga08182 [Eleusine coracana subsp. coracana]|uniref:eIF-4F 25 kDa subunit n=1 Tax=Eleusine coracana subsp. coracana TaxID=191504 RepID=A0AAV5C0N9_ELECO|nr:hypothetical protein PR202_ga08182 [Eleusine coracana subsp. coracana]
MAAEDIDTRPTSAGSRGRAPPEDDRDREEGEIADDDSGSHAPPPPTKHQLEHAWTFWFDNPQGKSKQAAWGSSIRPIHTFSTVEDFWGLYNNIHRPSKLVVGADFHCFKEKIEPKWEDPICANGVVSVRGKQERIAIWTKDAANEAAQISIGKQWKEFLDYKDSIGFIVHDDAKKADKGPKNRYTV